MFFRYQDWILIWFSSNFLQVKFIAINRQSLNISSLFSWTMGPSTKIIWKQSRSLLLLTPETQNTQLHCCLNKSDIEQCIFFFFLTPAWTICVQNLIESSLKLKVFWKLAIGGSAAPFRGPKKLLQNIIHSI